MSYNPGSVTQIERRMPVQEQLIPSAGISIQAWLNTGFSAIK